MKKLCLFLFLLGVVSLNVFGQGAISGGGTISGTGSISSSLGVFCGPPLYACSSTSTANPGQVSSIFTSTASGTHNTICTGTGIGPGGSGSGCLNSVAYDTSVNPVGIDPYTRVTDSGSSCGAQGQSFNATASGGNNDRVISLPLNDGTYYYVPSTTGGFRCLLHIAITSVGGHVAIQTTNVGAPISLGGGGFSFSNNPSTPNVYYTFTNSHIISKCTIASDTSFSCSQLVDVASAGVCGGMPQPFTPTSNGILTVTGTAGSPFTDDAFITNISNAGAQNTAIYAVAYSQTLGCSVFNINSGVVTNGSTAIGTAGCYGGNTSNGIHDSLASLNGGFAYLTTFGTWTNCGSQSSGDYDVWTPFTTTTQLCTAASVGDSCVDHTSIGVNISVSNAFTGAVKRPNSNVASLTVVSAAYSPPLGDWHSALPNYSGLVDSTPLLVTSVLKSAGLGTGCTGGATSVYCPNWPQAMIFAVPLAAYPPGLPFPVFGHGFTCGESGGAIPNCVTPQSAVAGPDSYFQGQQSIAASSPDGKFLCVTSSMFNNLGLDVNGNPRSDVFCILLE